MVYLSWYLGKLQETHVVYSTCKKPIFKHQNRQQTSWHSPVRVGQEGRHLPLQTVLFKGAGSCHGCLPINLRNLQADRAFMYSFAAWNHWNTSYTTCAILNRFSHAYRDHRPVTDPRISSTRCCTVPWLWQRKSLSRSHLHSTCTSWLISVHLHKQQILYILATAGCPNFACPRFYFRRWRLRPPIWLDFAPEFYRRARNSTNQLVKSLLLARLYVCGLSCCEMLSAASKLNFMHGQCFKDVH